jgi:glycine hydroxymethyltransferase
MVADIVKELRSITTRHEAWRSRCINLIPSENVTSKLARRMLASDFGHRYFWQDPWYAGQKYTEQVEQLAVEAAKRLFNVEYANVRPLSGHLSLMAVVMGLLTPGDPIVVSHADNGGYPLNLQARFPLEIHHFPYRTNRYVMDAEGAAELVERVRPRLVVFGASIFLFPHPVREVSKAARKVGATVAYDGSHVLGLIAGGQFQDPFGEGADILLGSTHKTLPGPQGGLILLQKHGQLAEQVDATLRPPPILVDNFHMNRVAALAVTLAELIQFGKAYAQQVVRNAQVLAKSLHEEGVRLVGEEQGFTASHQVLLDVANLDEGIHVRNRLEQGDIIADAGVRLGTQEVTRRGMREPDMKLVATLIADLLVHKVPPSRVKKQANALADQFQGIQYCFPFEE